VADFGISRVKDPTKSYLSATNNNGTPMYMAPEQFNGTHLDEKVRVCNHPDGRAHQSSKQILR
jgi:serine/threonine protein kinase